MLNIIHIVIHQYVRHLSARLQARAKPPALPTHVEPNRST